MEVKRAVRGNPAMKLQKCVRLQASYKVFCHKMILLSYGISISKEMMIGLKIINNSNQGFNLKYFKYDTNV